MAGPYLVATKRESRSPIQDGPPNGDGYCRGFVVTTDVVSRVAVVTLEEARNECHRIVSEEYPAVGGIDRARLALAIERLPEEGGPVGPLPDGTVIEVEPVSDVRLATQLGGSWLTRVHQPTSYNELAVLRPELCAAWNAKHGVNAAQEAGR